MAALDGAHVAGAVLRYLDSASGSDGRPQRGVRLLVDAPLRWISPGLLRRDDPAPARGHYLLWTEELIRRPTVFAHQDGRMIASRRIRWPASPGRVFRLPADLLDPVDRSGGDVRIGFRRD